MFSKFRQTFSKNRPKASKEAQQKLSFDQQLVWQQTKPKKVPSARQLKYLSRFLSARERAILSIAALAMVVSLGALGAFLYRKYVTPVPTEGGAYEEALVGYPIYINPILASTNDVDLDLVSLIFSGLMRYDNELQLQTDLAESLVISENQLEYNLVLKNNLFWQDGEPITIDDVIFTYNRIQDPSVNSPLQFSLQDVAIKRIDDRTVQFDLENPYAGFSSLLTVGILPQHLWANIPPANMRLAELNIRPIGSGSWEFSKLKKDREGNIHSYTLVPSSDYYGKKPYIQQLTFRFFPDFSSAIDALNNNQVEGISFVPRQLIPNINNANSFTTHQLQLPQYTAIFFNEERNDILENKDVRQALAYGIDRQRLIEDVLDNQGALANAPLLEGMIGYHENLEGYPYNPVEAQRLLEESGWKKISADEYIEFVRAQLEDQESSNEDSSEIAEPPVDESFQVDTAGQTTFRKKGNDILTITLTTVDQPENRRAAEVIKNAWQSIGFKVNLEIVPVIVFTESILPSRQYEALLYGQILNIEPDPYSFWHSTQVNHPGLNLAGFVNKNADKLLEEARQTTDYETRNQKLKEFQQIIDEELPAVFLFSPEYTYIFSEKIKGFAMERIGIPANRLQNINDWYIKTKRHLIQ